MIIFPPPCFFICCTAALVHKKVPLRLNWMTLSHSSSVRSSTVASLLGIMVLPLPRYQDINPAEPGDD